MVILLIWLFVETLSLVLFLNKMQDEDVDDFIVVTDGPFPLSCRDAKLYFDITWKNKTSKSIINCRIKPDVKSKAEERMKLVKAKSTPNHPSAK